MLPNCFHDITAWRNTNNSCMLINVVAVLRCRQAWDADDVCDPAPDATAASWAEVNLPLISTIPISILDFTWNFYVKNYVKIFEIHQQGYSTSQQYEVQVTVLYGPCLAQLEMLPLHLLPAESSLLIPCHCISFLQCGTDGFVLSTFCSECFQRYLNLEFRRIITSCEYINNNIFAKRISGAWKY